MSSPPNLPDSTEAGLPAFRRGGGAAERRRGERRQGGLWRHYIKERTEKTMLFKRKRVDLAELPLEQVRFSSQDLFCLLGGLDTCGCACSPATLDLDRVEAERPQEGSGSVTW